MLGITAEKSFLREPRHVKYIVPAFQGMIGWMEWPHPASLPRRRPSVISLCWILQNRKHSVGRIIGYWGESWWAGLDGRLVLFLPTIIAQPLGIYHRCSFSASSQKNVFVWYVLSEWLAVVKRQPWIYGSFSKHFSGNLSQPEEKQTLPDRWCWAALKPFKNKGLFNQGFFQMEIFLWEVFV